MPLRMTLQGARVMRPGGWEDGPLAMAEGVLCDAPTGRHVDLQGFDILPGIVDAHGDGFERHVAPRRGALREPEAGVLACAHEMAAAGITTAVLAQFWSWEGGLRGPDFAEDVFDAVARVAPTVPMDLRMQLRLETHLLDTFDRVAEVVARCGIDYVVFNDHLPHDRLAEGRRPPRLTGQALKSGRNPEAHFRMLLELHARGPEVPGALDEICARLQGLGVTLGSHDDRDAESRAAWRARGARLAEFPETRAAAEAARQGGDGIVLGAPNVVRGASHKGNASALELIEAGLCDALASDYHYPSPARAARRCVELGVLDEVVAWRLVSEGPARLLGLSDRGRLAPGLRADLVIRERATGRLAATLCGGAVAFMSGAVAARFLG
ncbi:alpha-D-ribose 1-methylphosphonate 5-triphosphate diphosphatase [Pseudoponticoccus marisrubri]|uniref:Phosphonate metabolism protein PhnM n=1 Tax=Pseudoponticoccus marisrubri TaxID=1685382 RepID=A0A0W7WG26_9RHOB|nr:alpha-D-ribose 1-methylphosphonate 5-triphosphate diphosphatase [Pseudoponticoccus marisrubri]KUF09431.1 phosphonate metabolism protein PhnM [Pseudoponticoccus marisrubri]